MTPEERTARLDELDKAIAEANAPLRYRGPGLLKLALLSILQLFVSISSHISHIFRITGAPDSF